MHKHLMMPIKKDRPSSEIERGTPNTREDKRYRAIARITEMEQNITMNGAYNPNFTEDWKRKSRSKDIGKKAMAVNYAAIKSLANNGK